MAHTQRIPTHDSALARAAADFCTRAPLDEAEAAGTSSPHWHAVRETGSELWLDSGDLEKNREVWTREFGGLTTNNSLLNREVQKGLYDAVIPEAAAELRRADPDLSDDELVPELAFVINAIHGRKLAHVFDADVSVELHTDLVHDADGSYEYGRRLHAICPTRFVIKVALSPAGLLAARRLERDGIRVNCTLGFSPRQNHLIASVARPHFVNVFLGRVNSLFEQLARRGLDDGAGDGIQPGVAATIASQRTVRELIRTGQAAAHTRQIAASMREGSQVAALAGIDVLTMPTSAAEEFASSAGAAVVEDRTHKRTEREPPPGAPGAATAATGVFFRVGDESLAAAGHLQARDADALDAPRICAVLGDCGLGDMFPELDDRDLELIADDGKIPDVDRWADRVAAGAASWDGLLTAAATAAFATDQAALDDRIRDLLR